jgi:hypothetical protein
MTFDRSAPVTVVASVALAFVFLGCGTTGSGGGGEAPASGAAPETSHDGLALVKKTRSTALYLRPGVSFAQYDRLAILECPVAFRKSWQRDQNEDRVDLQQRVSARDMERIKAELSKEFLRVFKRELETRGGYRIVETGGPDVLVLRPAIVNLDVSTPDLMPSGRVANLQTSAGSMTLYLELYDSMTSQILGRYIDAEGDTQGMVQIADRVTNMQAADVILTRWADTLRKGLDRAHAKAAEQAAGEKPAGP